MRESAKSNYRAARRRRRLLAATVAAAILSAALGRPRPAAAQQYTLDSSASEGLTAYLREHRLPLVGAQVGASPSGARRVVLYGYVATPFGRSDAESKAVAYLGPPPPLLVNRIVIQPEIGAMHKGSARAATPDAGAAPQNAAPGAAAGGETLGQVLDDIQRYGVHSVPAGPPPQ